MKHIIALICALGLTTLLGVTPTAQDWKVQMRIHVVKGTIIILKQTDIANPIIIREGTTTTVYPQAWLGAPLIIETRSGTLANVWHETR